MDYSKALSVLNLESLDKRREGMALKFVKNSLKNDNFCNYVTIICDQQFTKTEALALGRGARSAQKFWSFKNS